VRYAEHIMASTEIIWIAGPSAIGKKTLIQILQQPEQRHIRQRLELSGTLRHFPKNLDEQLGKAIPLKDLATFVEDVNGGVLVKWQMRSRKFPAILRDKHSSPNQRMICLWRPTFEHMPDYVRKHCGGRKDDDCVCRYMRDREANYGLILNYRPSWLPLVIYNPQSCEILKCIPDMK
jgi:hypothetical protein